MNNIHDLNRAFLTVARHMIAASREKAIMLLNLTSEQCDALDMLSFSEVECLAKTDSALFNFKLKSSDIRRMVDEESSNARSAIVLLASGDKK